MADKTVIPQNRVLRAVVAAARALNVRAYLVGGPLRDLLLGRPMQDIDVAVEGDVQRFGPELARRLNGTFRFYDAFETGTVLLKTGRHVDVARTRTEVYARPAGLPRVTGADIRADLARRDFTINALAWHLLDRKLLDPFHGLADLHRKVVRVLHDRSFQDDPTRIFRAVRFSGRLGFRLLPDTNRQMKAAAAAGLVELLSGKRVLTELRLVCAEPGYQAMFAALNAHRAFRVPKSALRRLARLQTLGPDLRLLGLLALLPDTGKLPLTREQRADIADIQRFPSCQAELRRARKPSAVFTVLRTFRANALLVRECWLPPGLARKVRAHMATYSQTMPRLHGADLKVAGIKPGPVYARILENLRLAQLDGKVKTRADELALVRRTMAWDRKITKLKAQDPKCEVQCSRAGAGGGR